MGSSRQNILHVIAGSARGRRLEVPPVGATRPFLERARGALFNILSPRLPGASILDLYAGSGALGIEALSRGAERAVFVEADPRAAETIRSNLDHCACRDRAEVVEAELPAALDRVGGVFDLIFLDPPFARAREWIDSSEGMHMGRGVAGRLAQGGQAMLRVERGTSLPECWEGLARTDTRRWGRSEVCFYCNTTA